MILNPNELCPCESNLMLKECCLLDTPPLVERDQGYSSIFINKNFPNKPAPSVKIKTKMTIRKPQQLNSRILNIIELVPAQIYSHNLYIRDLDDSLHACHYHKRQFLYRLRLLRNEQLLLYRPIYSDSIVEMDDMPLRYEFEAYVSRLRVSLDVLAKFVASMINKENITTNGKLFKFLNQAQNQKKFPELNQIYEENAEWINNLKVMRDAIQHDGYLPNFNSFIFDKATVTHPDVNGISAYYICFQYWRHLLNIINSILNVLFQPKNNF